MDEVRNLIIIGSGPAGYTAAVYAARANLKPLVIEGVQSGGALMTTTEVENFPGFPDGVMGPELMDSMRKQAERFGAEFITDDATRVELTGEIKTVWVGETPYQAPAVILATGSAWRPLGVPGEQELLGHGVSSCATCDGFFFRGQRIAVVGGGDSAMEEATFLTRFAESVTIIHRRDQFRASKIMADRALADPKIRVEWNTVVDEVLGKDGKVCGVRVRDVHTGETRTLDVTGVFVAIGHDPRSELFRGQVDLDESGYVMVDAPSTRTSLTGVFAAGDLVDHTYRQAITAAGTGCAAALDAERYLASLAA
ncbi:MAG: thioredoxin-disulfide reductase [Micromonosporaceae bacterium]|nr:thioredoxin-disulfide reductase [Micromonosporaceae bacterium]